MNLADRKREIDEWFNSEKGEEYFSRIRREQDRETIWIDKISQLEKTLDDNKLETLMMKFVDWEYEFQMKRYRQGVNSCSNILALLFEFAYLHGTSIENNEDFPTESVEFRGFVINLTHGQGSIIWIKYEGERIL